MLKYENDCVGCPQGCVHCGRKKVLHLYCDKCREEVDRLFKWDGDEWCLDCIEKELEEVKVDG